MTQEPAWRKNLPRFSKRFTLTYDLTKPLGEGPNGSTYVGLYKPEERRVAIKLLRSLNPRDLARFQRETRALKALDHPAILRVFGALDEPLVDEIAHDATHCRKRLSQTLRQLTDAHAA